MGRQATLIISKGQRFGRGTVLDPEVRRKGLRCARMRCDCGTVYVTGIHRLVRGYCKSCGCWRAENGRLIGGRSYPYRGGVT